MMMSIKKALCFFCFYFCFYGNKIRDTYYFLEGDVMRRRLEGGSGTGGCLGRTGG
jgi:hypothetical protein